MSISAASPSTQHSAKTDHKDVLNKDMEKQLKTTAELAGLGGKAQFWTGLAQQSGKSEGMAPFQALTEKELTAIKKEQSKLSESIMKSIPQFEGDGGIPAQPKTTR